MGLHNALLDYLSSIREDLGTGITLNKFQQRAFNIRTENDCLFFEMERHSAALGATYRPGTPMTVYTTRHGRLLLRLFCNKYLYLQLNYAKIAQKNAIFTKIVHDDEGNGMDDGAIGCGEPAS